MYFEGKEIIFFWTYDFMNTFGWFNNIGVVCLVMWEHWIKCIYSMAKEWKKKIYQSNAEYGVDSISEAIIDLIQRKTEHQPKYRLNS